jgi:hypothetical protein
MKSSTKGAPLVADLSGSITGELTLWRAVTNSDEFRFSPRVKGTPILMVCPLRRFIAAPIVRFLKWTVPDFAELECKS